MASHLALNNNVAPNAWWNIDPNRVLGLYGPANRYEFLETPYLYPRVAYTVDPIPALPQYTTFHIARNRRRAIEKTYVFMDNRVRNRNYVGSGLVNAIPGQITSQHEFRIFCATLYETIRGPRPSSARDSRINETGEPRERVLTIMGQGYLHNFHHLLKHATRVHLTYVIDIQGILEACAQLGWHMAACTQTQIPVGPLRLYHLERIFHTLLNNPRIDPHPLNVPKHVCFNVILRLKRITGPNARQNHLNICNAVMDQFHRAILTLPVPQRDIIRSVNIWEAFGPMRAPPQSAYGGDHRIQLNNPGMWTDIPRGPPVNPQNRNGQWPTKNQHPPVPPVSYIHPLPNFGALRHKTLWKCSHGTHARQGVQKVKDKRFTALQLYRNEDHFGFTCCPNRPHQGAHATQSGILIMNNNATVNWRYPR